MPHFRHRYSSTHVYLYSTSASLRSTSLPQPMFCFLIVVALIVAALVIVVVVIVVVVVVVVVVIVCMSSGQATLFVSIRTRNAAQESRTSHIYMVVYYRMEMSRMQGRHHVTHRCEREKERQKRYIHAVCQTTPKSTFDERRNADTLWQICINRRSHSGTR